MARTPSCGLFVVKNTTHTSDIAAVRAVGAGVGMTAGIHNSESNAVLDKPLRRRLPEPVTEAEVDALIRAAAGDTTPEGLRLSAILQLFNASGLRVPELVALPLGGLGHGERTIAVYGKGGNERVVPISQLTRIALDAYLECRFVFLDDERPSRWLFPGRSSSGHLTNNRCGQMLKVLAVKAGIDSDKLSPYGLRHAFVPPLFTGDTDTGVPEIGADPEIDPLSTGTSIVTGHRAR